jgi:hypothetical protein
VVVILGVFVALKERVRVLKWMYWSLCSSPLLHRLGLTDRIEKTLIRSMRHLKSQPVCFLTKSDAVRTLVVSVLKTGARWTLDSLYLD